MRHLIAPLGACLLATTSAHAQPSTDAEALQSLKSVVAWMEARPEAPPKPADAPLPKLQMASVEADPKSGVAHVTLRLVNDKGELQPPTTTAYIAVLTQNGQNSAYQDGQFKRVEKTVVFRAGGGAEQGVAIPLNGWGSDGQWFTLYTPNTENVGLTKGGATSARITFKKGASNPDTPYVAPAARAPRKGELVYAFAADRFKASDAGGDGIARTRFSHGRTQDGNSELGYYTDPAQQKGTRSWEIRDGLLVLRAEKFPAPLDVKVDGVVRRFDYGASVVQFNWLSQLYGYYEFEVQDASARGTWTGLWLLPSDGSWPPEIDVMESPNNGGVQRGHITTTHHWGSQADHKALGAHLQLDRTPEFAGFDRTTGFHTYAVDWRADYTTWYVDGKEVWRTPTKFHKAAFPLADLAVGGWGGTPDFGAGTTELKIRSIKVWK